MNETLRFTIRQEYHKKTKVYVVMFMNEYKGWLEYQGSYYTLARARDKVAELRTELKKGNYECLRVRK